MLRASFLALGLAFLTPAAAHPGRECKPIKVVLDKAATIGGSNVRQLEGYARDNAVTYYNAQPPESSEKYEIAYLVDMPQGGLLLLGNEGQLCSSILVLPAEWLKLRTVLEGRGI